MGHAETKSSSRRWIRSSNRANPAAAACSSSPTGWRPKCTNSATCKARRSWALPVLPRGSRLQKLPHPSFDPDREFRIPWQTGMNGIIVRRTWHPDVRSVCDLFDPKYKGKVVDAERAPRHRAAGDEVPRGRPEEAERSNDWLKRSTDRSRRATAARSAASPATTTPPILTRAVVAVIGWSGDAVSSGRQPEHRERGCRSRADPLVGQHGHPDRGAEHGGGRGVHGLRMTRSPEVNTPGYSSTTPVEDVQPILAKRIRRSRRTS